MHDPMELVRELALRAREEEAPRGHVARKVLVRLHEAPDGMSRPLALLTALAAMAAVVSLGLEVVSAQWPASDPLGAFFQVASLL